MTKRNTDNRSLANSVFVQFLFFFNDTATTEIYTLSLHDALPIYLGEPGHILVTQHLQGGKEDVERSEEHTSELQSRQYLVCRLLLEKNTTNTATTPTTHTYRPPHTHTHTHTTP